MRSVMLLSVMLVACEAALPYPAPEHDAGADLQSPQRWQEPCVPTGGACSTDYRCCDEVGAVIGGCVAGACLRFEGRACESDLDCASRRCVDRLCSPRG